LRSSFVYSTILEAIVNAYDDRSRMKNRADRQCREERFAPRSNWVRPKGWVRIAGDPGL